MSNTKPSPTARPTKRTSANGVTENVNGLPTPEAPSGVEIAVQTAMLASYLLTKLVRVATWNLAALGLLTLLTLLNLSGVFS